MWFLRRLCAFVGCLLALAGCGSGGSFEPQVNAVESLPIQYGKKATIYVGGINLNAGMVADFGAGCTAPSYAESSSPTLAVLNCTVVTAGELGLTLRSAAGKVLAQTSFTVPLPHVVLSTVLGSMTLELDPRSAPETVDNFLAYVSAGFYTDTLFHRVIPGFVIQAGGFTSGMVQKTDLKAPIALESNNGLSNLRGTVAMARSSAPDSATSQFFINLVDNLSLNYTSDASPGYAVFGRVISGMDVADAIATTPTTSVNGYADVPTNELPISVMVRLQ